MEDFSVELEHAEQLNMRSSTQRRSRDSTSGAVAKAEVAAT